MVHSNGKIYIATAQKACLDLCIVDKTNQSAGPYTFMNCHRSLVSLVSALINIAGQFGKLVIVKLNEYSGLGHKFDCQQKMDRISCPEREQW